MMLHIGAGHSNNCQIILKLFGYDIYLAIICSTKKFKANLEVSEALITYVTNRKKARVMLHIRADHSNNCQIILKLFRYDTHLAQKKFKANLEVSEVLITYVTNKKKTRVMLHMGAGRSNSHRIKIQYFLCLNF